MKRTKPIVRITRCVFSHVLCAVVVFCIVMPALGQSGDVVKERGRPLLGVQRWDMYSGKGATQQQELGYLPGKQGFLKPSEWHDRAPFFCRLTKDVNSVEHPERAGPLRFNYPFSQEYLQNAMDQEIRYAYNAGIDFFVYHGPARRLFANAWELKNNLDAHMASKIPEAKKMKFVWALYGNNAINYPRSKVAAMMDETIEWILRHRLSSCTRGTNILKAAAYARPWESHPSIYPIPDGLMRWPRCWQ